MTDLNIDKDKAILEGEIDNTISHGEDGAERPMPEQIPLMQLRKKLDTLIKAIDRVEQLEAKAGVVPVISSSDRDYVEETARDYKLFADTLSDKAARTKMENLLKQRHPSLAKYISYQKK